MDNQTSHPSEQLEFMTLDHVEDSRHDYKFTRTTTQVGEDKTTHLVSERPNAALQRTGSSSSGFPTIGRDALIANQAEHRMTVRDALRIYPKAIGWAFGISFAIIVSPSSRADAGGRPATNTS